MLPCYIKRHRALSRVYLWPASLESPERLSPSPIPPQMNRPDFSLRGKAACRANRSATASADKWVFSVHLCAYIRVLPASFSTTIEDPFLPSFLPSEIIFGRDFHLSIFTTPLYHIFAVDFTEIGNRVREFLLRVSLR